MSAQQPALAPDRKNILTTSDNILKEVSELRGLPAKNPIKSGFKSRKELQEIVVRDLDEETTPAELKSQQKLLVRLGLVPKTYDLREETIKLLCEQIGGFYDPRTGEFYLVDWLELEEQKPVMAHELMHAVQDQNFNLKRFDKFPKEKGDQELAIQALIEGEATIVMFNYLFKERGLDITKMPVPISSLLELANNSDDERFPILAKTPRAIRETLEFPYIYGAAFVQQVVGKNSWKKIADLYNSELIESTEQILHPEKAIQREHPVEIKMPELLSQLGEGWHRSDINTQGEYGYYQSLLEFLDKDVAQKASAGWGGDQYMFFDRADNDNNILVQFSTWDTEKDAEEFFQAYVERTNKRYSKTKQITNEKNIITYIAGEEFLVIERRGLEVLSIEGGTESQLKSLKDSIWKGYSKKADTSKVIAKN
ncbi:MAG: hypothetical protein HY819_05970 [Acidobacteria bacterium]|nr:hypothetical protein [Acidobacteriota bacterium]